MNQRIKLLAEQAAATKKYVPPVWQFYDDELEKFAKLIVRECADIASDVGTDTVPTDFALDKCYEIESKTKERFGVK